MSVIQILTENKSGSHLFSLAESLHVRSGTEICWGTSTSSAVTGRQGSDVSSGALSLVPALQLVGLVHVGVDLWKELIHY